MKRKTKGQVGRAVPASRAGLPSSRGSGSPGRLALPKPPPRGRLALGVQWGPKNPRPPSRDLPFVFVNVAMTADGKLAPASRHFEPFGTRRDRLLLLELRTYADAIMSGARTIDLNPVTLSNGGEYYTRRRVKRELAPFPIRIVVSGHATLDPRAAIFNHRFSPILVLASHSAPEKRLKPLRALADEVGVFGRDEVDFAAAFRWLRAKWNIKTLLCEGGGEVNAALFQAGLVRELYVTVCPVIFGGDAAPTLADGTGVPRLTQAAPLTLHAQKRVQDELFLVYRAQ